MLVRYVPEPAYDRRPNKRDYYRLKDLKTGRQIPGLIAGLNAATIAANEKNRQHQKQRDHDAWLSYF